MHKSDTVCHKLKRKTENNRLREDERSVWPLVWWGVLVLAKGRTGKMSITAKDYFGWFYVKFYPSQKYELMVQEIRRINSEIERQIRRDKRFFFYFYFIFFFLFWQKGDETQLQNPSPRHRRVWQVDFHEEPQGCPWLRLLHEGEARCPWSEFEHFVAGPRVCFYVFHRWLSATWSSRCTWFCVRWTFKRWTFWARKTNLTNRTCGANLIWCVA